MTQTSVDNNKKQPSHSKLLNPMILALGIFLLTAVWMLSGMLFADEQTEQSADTESSAGLQSVEIATYKATALNATLQFSGQSKAGRISTLSAEAEGTLLDLLIPRGSTVKTGDIIAQLSSGAISAELSSAKANLKRASVEYDTQLTLVNRGLAASNSIQPVSATLAQAKAQLAKITEQQANTSIIAPFNGLLAQSYPEAGDFVRVGDKIADVIQLDTIKIIGNVSEKDVLDLKLKQQAKITLLNGNTLAGEISFISPVADSATRTYQIEVVANNQDGALLSGMTTKVEIDTGISMAHKINPSLLVLDEKGNLSLRAVNAENIVTIHAIKINKTEASGIWISGLPDSVNLITRGQGFVSAGQAVETSFAAEQ